MKPRQLRFLMASVGLLAIALCTTAWIMPVVDLASAMFVGVSAYDRAGESVAIIGDLNADGYDDMLIGARGGDVLVNTGGGAYLFLGTSAPDWGTNLVVNQADATFGRAGYQDYAGHDVTGAGDVNADGYDDFLIGADGYDTPGGLAKAGRVHLFFGRQAADWGQGFDVANSDASFVGETANANTGHALAGAGDVNGDGYDDFLFASHPEVGGGDYETIVYLFLGNDSPAWGRDASPSTTADASFVLDGNDFGLDVSLAGTGDVNGDGYDDFVVGSWFNHAYLVLGRAAADWSLEFDLANADATLVAEHAVTAVAGAGDVNGDGLQDMLVTSSLMDDGGENTGKAYLVLGRAAADWGSAFDLANADASFYGENDGDEVGCAASGAGDVNGDAYDDFAIGACKLDAPAVSVDTGGAYLVFGKPDGWQANVDLTSTDTARDLLALPGEGLDDLAGTGLAGAGDVNGDGFADLLVGAPDHDRDASTLDVGKVYLVLGSGLALHKTADAPPVAPGEQIDYSIRYTNTNPWPVQDVRILDPVPDHTTYVACSGGVTCGRLLQTVWWNLGTVPAGGTGAVDLVVEVDPDTLGVFIHNTAWITAPSRVNPVYSRVIVHVSPSEFNVYLPVVVREHP